MDLAPGLVQRQTGVFSRLELSTTIAVISLHPLTSCYEGVLPQRKCHLKTPCAVPEYADMLYVLQSAELELRAQSSF